MHLLQRGIFHYDNVTPQSTFQVMHFFSDPACQRSAQTCCTQGRLSEAGSQQSEEAEAQARAAEAEQEG